MFRNLLLVAETLDCTDFFNAILYTLKTIFTFWWRKLMLKSNKKIRMLKNTSDANWHDEIAFSNLFNTLICTLNIPSFSDELSPKGTQQRSTKHSMPHSWRDIDIAVKPRWYFTFSCELFLRSFFWCHYLSKYAKRDRNPFFFPFQDLQLVRWNTNMFLLQNCTWLGAFHKHIPYRLFLDLTTKTMNQN